MIIPLGFETGLLVLFSSILVNIFEFISPGFMHSPTTILFQLYISNKKSTRSRHQDCSSSPLRFSGCSALFEEDSLYRSNSQEPLWEVQCPGSKAGFSICILKEV